METQRFLRCRIWVITASLFAIIGCGGDNGSPSAPEDEEVAVSISPHSTRLEPGQAEQFTATVTGSSETTVTWTVTSGPGTVSSVGLYTAPATIVGDSAIAEVTATATVDSTASDRATITIVPQQPGNVIVTISPLLATISVGQTTQFTASVTGASDTTVTWSVGSGPGSVDRNGLYTAPTSIDSDSITTTVKASANAAPSASAVALVTIKQIPPGADSDVVRTGYFGSQDLYELGAEYAVICVEAVYLASELGGGGQVLITTGTVSENTGGTYSYSPTPQDRLRAVFLNGTELDFYITSIDGDFTVAAEDFLTTDHEFNLRAVRTGQDDLQISSTYGGGTVQGSLSGTFTDEDTFYTVNVSLTGTYYSDVSFGGAEVEHDETLTGTVSAAGFSMSVSDNYYFHAVYVDNLVQNLIRTTNNAWTSGSDTYQLVNVRIRRSFYNYQPSELDTYWLAEGVLHKNGAVFGTVGWGIEGNQIKVWLDLPDERLILETWNL